MTVRIPGLGARVEVEFDAWDIPFVTASNSADAATAVGWLHADSRMFMMDVMRRAARGRLAEVIGRPGLASDRLMRTFGFGRAVDAEYELLPDDVRAELQGYADGVNAWIAAHPKQGRGVELRALRVPLEPWRPSDCLVTSRLFALGLCGNWEAELTRAEVLARFGPDILSVYDGDDHSRTDAALGVTPEVLRALREASATVEDVIGSRGPGAGSNAWAVAPSRTRTGGAILAGDTHLDLSLPCTWFELGTAVDGEYRVRGCTIPGSPGVVIGTNGHVAWTLVNSTADVQDLYAERIHDTTDRYLDADGAWQALDVREEHIGVRLGKTRVHRVRSTPRGPLLTDVIGHGIDDAAPHLDGAHLALRWPTGSEPGTIAMAVHQLARATDEDELRAAAALWTAPSQQLVYATSDGTIGRQIVGRIPVRAGSDGSLPLNAHDPAGEWLGDVPPDQLPWERNPSTGFVACANDRFEPEAEEGNEPAPFVSRDWCNPYRALRIRSVLAGESETDIGDHAALQLDTMSIPGLMLRDLVERRDVTPSSEPGRRALGALLAWDGDMDARSSGGAVYDAVMHHLRDVLWAPLGDLAAAMLGDSRGPAGGTYPTMFGRATPRILHDIEHDDTMMLALDPERSGGWDELLAEALDAAGRTLDRACGDEEWQWGTVHRIRVAHGLGFIPGVHKTWSRGPWPSGGDHDTVWQAAPAPKVHNDWAVVGPAQRFVIDLADPDRSEAILCGGQSGHPNSPHYADQLELWYEGHLRPMPLTAPAVTAAAVRRTTFAPH